MKCLIGARFCLSVMFRNSLCLNSLSGDKSQKLILFNDTPVPKFQLSNIPLCFQACFALSGKVSARMARTGLRGQEPLTNSLSPPSAHESLKIPVHCRHFRNLLFLFLGSVVAF